MLVRSVIKVINCTTYRNLTIASSIRMSQKSLLSFFQKKPIVSEEPLCSIKPPCNGISSDAGMFPGGSESSNMKKPSGNDTPLDTARLQSDVKSSNRKSEDKKSSSASKTKKMSNAKKTPARKKTEKAETLSDIGESSKDMKSSHHGKSKGNTSVDEKAKHSKTQVKKPVSKTPKSEKTTVEEITKNEKFPSMVDVESHNGGTSTDREKSPEATESPIVQKKRRRVAIIESDSEDESAKALPAVKKARLSSDEADAKAREAVDEEADSKNAVEKVNTKEFLEPAEKKQKNEAEVCDTPNPILRTLSYLGTKKKRSPKPKKSSEKAKTKSPKDKKTVAKTPTEIDEIKEKADPVDVDSSTTLKSKSEEKETNREDGEVQKTTGTISGNKENNTSLLNRKTASDVIGSKYNPGKEKYDPIKDAPWKHGDKTPYLALAKTLQKIEETSARLKIIEILSNYFRTVIVLNEKDLLPSIYLCLNKLGPAYEGQELGIAETYLMKAVAQCTGRTLVQIKTDAAESGDLGIVAEQSRSNQRIMFRPAHLTVQSVFNQLSEIAAVSGHSAVSKKIDKIQALFVACRDCEARFVIRSLAGKLRIGLAEQSVLQALALACTITPPNQEHPHAILNASKTVSAAEFKKRAEDELLILKTTYCECPNYNLIVPVLLQDGVAALPERCKITPGIPVKPMLAQPTKGVQEVLQRFDGIKFTCEWKYDGERAQIHLLEDGTIKIYSRNQEDNTSKYPDIIADIKKTFNVEVNSCILDAEAVAWDQEQKKIMPFQILSTRKRKDASASEIKVRVCVFLFDVLYLNGDSLTRKTLAERRELLKVHFQEVEEKFKFVTSIDTNTMEEVQECLEESVKGNCEGLMVKTLDTDATYEIAKRSRNWLKLKKDYLEGCGDTLDLVVIGGYIGKGKRTGQYGGFLLASYDADNEEYQTICKIGTGFSEEGLAAHSEFLKQHVIPAAKPYYRYDTSHQPDHWFDAVQVWEVKCADLSLSPIYLSAVGLVDPEKGISLRFPRFLRIRDDKNVEQATSSQQVAELYQNQDQIKNAGLSTTSNFNEEDF